MSFTFNFLSSNNDIIVENCLCPKWLLCASVSDNLRYRAAVAVKKIFLKNILFFNKKIIFQKKQKNIFLFFGKNDFLVDFFGHIPRKTTYGRRPKK